MTEHVKDLTVNHFKEMFESEDVNSVDHGLYNWQNRKHRIRKKDLTRKIKHDWTEDEVVRLIAAVKEEPTIWDVSLADYRLSKLECWQTVVTKLAIENVDINEAKTKWSSLRVSYKQTLNKIQSETSQSFVLWRHFQKMSFLDSKDTTLQPTSSTLSTYLPNVFKAENSPESELSHVVVAPTSVKRMKFNNVTHCICKPSQSISPALSYESFHARQKDAKTKIPALSDINSTFCDYLLMELRGLSDQKARALRQTLSQTLFGFLNDVMKNAPMRQCTPISVTNDDGHNMNTPMRPANDCCQHNPSVFSDVSLIHADEIDDDALTPDIKQEYEDRDEDED